MAPAKFRAIIFDIGRVLIRVDISRAMDGLASGLSLTPREVWSAIQNDPHWLDWQEGRISPRDWHLHLTKRLGASLTFEQFSEVWNRALDPVPIIPKFSWRVFPRTTGSHCFRIPILSTCPMRKPVSPFSASFQSASILTESAQANLTRSSTARPSRLARSGRRKPFILTILRSMRRPPPAWG